MAICIGIYQYVNILTVCTWVHKWFGLLKGVSNGSIEQGSGSTHSPNAAFRETLNILMA